MTRSLISTVSVFLATLIFATASFCQEETQYKIFKLDDCTCHVGVLYRKSAGTMTIGVSAIAAGKGAEFRKWDISKIKLRIGSDRIRPDEESEFYVKKESFFRVPAAVLFAVIGATADVPGSSLQRGITQAGLAIGLGILALQARGELTGEKCTFLLTDERFDAINPGEDYIYITAENNDLHVTRELKIGLIKPSFGPGSGPDYKTMSESELQGELTVMEGRLSKLEKEQTSYRYGQDPEYDRIQSEIEKVQGERGIAYTEWLQKGANQ